MSSGTRTSFGFRVLNGIIRFSLAPVLEAVCDGECGLQSGLCSEWFVVCVSASDLSDEWFGDAEDNGVGEGEVDAAECVVAVHY
jgi:hypothetical protein